MMKRLCILCMISASLWGADEDRMESTVFARPVTIVWSKNAVTVSHMLGNGLTYSTQANGILVISNTLSAVDFIMSGSTTNGAIRIYSDTKFRLTLNACTLASPNGPAINIQSKKRCFLFLPPDTYSSLQDGTTYTAIGSEDAKAVVFSEGNLILCGSGALSIKGNTQKKHGICSDKRLRALGGTITILQQKTSSDGVHANDGIDIEDGHFNITLNADKGDGMDADSDGYFSMTGGELNISLSGTNCTAITTGTNTLSLINGVVSIQSTNKQVNALKTSGYAQLAGGALFVTLTGADCKAVRASSGITLSGTSGALNLYGAQSKGFSTDGAWILENGEWAIRMAGNSILTSAGVVTNGTTAYTAYAIDYSHGVKARAATIVNGRISISNTGIGGGGISVDDDLIITNGVLNIVTEGANSTIFTNTAFELDLATANCLRADKTITIVGGSLALESKGNCGKCISSGETTTLGSANGIPFIRAITRGTQVQVSAATSSGGQPGWGGGGGGENADYANPKAIKSNGTLVINNGTFYIATANKGGEGLESKDRITMNNGTLYATCYDDCMNATSNITFNGGYVSCTSTNNDAIDSNGSMTINGGTIVACGATAPEEGLDCDQNTFTITGGTYFGLGGATSKPTTGSQYSFIYTGTISQGTVIALTRSTGTVVALKSPRTYSGSAVVLCGTTGMSSGTTWTLTTGATINSAETFGGIYMNATASGGTSKISTTFSGTTMYKAN